MSIARKRTDATAQSGASEAGALDVLAGQVIGAKVNREAVEVELDRLPRWRFMRRAELEREVDRSRTREQRLLGLVRDV